MAYDKRMGDFTYRLEEKGAVITGYEGRETKVKVPDYLEEQPVYKIGKKAFLSSKTMLELELPETVKCLEEWAFAYCSSLKKVWVPAKKMSFGKGVFFACHSLQEIRCEKESGEPQPWALLGMVPVMLDAEYLLTPWEAKEPHWVEKWDARLLAILRADDEEGYSKEVLCGEEDLSASFEEFVARKQQTKSLLAFIRLMNPYLLQEVVEKELLTYVREHTKGCLSEASWEVVKQHGEEQAFFEIFTKTGCLTEENFDQVLEDLGQYYAEMKAYFIRYRENSMKKPDFFDTLSLDF